MTKTIVLGAERTKTKKYTDIKFIKVLTGDYRVETTDYLHTMTNRPEEWAFIELVSKGYGSDMDLMFAYGAPDKREDGYLFIGYWNDGVVGQ